MNKYTIKKDVSVQYDISESGGQWTVAKGATISAGVGFYGISEQSPYSSNTLIINGTVESDATTGAGVYLGGTGDTMTIASSGVVRGSLSISLQGTDQTLNNAGLLDGDVSLGNGNYELTNTGTIKTTGNGVSWRGDNVDFNNNGVIHAGLTGILLFNSTSEITLGVNSVITGKYAFTRQNDAGLDSRTINDGTMSGSTLSFVGAAGNETLVNHGTMSGEIRLYDGNDVFDNRGGVFAGAVSGGNGNDVYYVNSRKITVVEYANAVDSQDKVYATVSYALDLSYSVEKLILLGQKNIGGTGDNTDNAIFGNNGRNRISGLQGDDTLTGRGGADAFVFSNGFDQDTVADFKDGTDRIDVSGCTSFHDFKTLKAGHLSFQDGGALITNGHDTLFVEHVAKGELGASDFLF